MIIKLFILISFNLLIFLNIYDCYSTIFLLNAGAIESNPGMRWIMSYLGIVPSLIITKIFFFLILLYVIYKVFIDNLTPREKYLTVFALIILNSYYTYFLYTRNYQYMLIMN